MTDIDPRRADAGRGDSGQTDQVIPVIEETAVVTKRVVQTGRVRVHTSVEERTELIGADLEREEVVVERVPMGHEITAVPAVRHEGDVMIVSVVEEVLVIEKRMVLKEELRIRTRRTVERVEEPVVLRRTVATVDRSNIE